MIKSRIELGQINHGIDGYDIIHLIETKEDQTTREVMDYLEERTDTNYDVPPGAIFLHFVLVTPQQYSKTKFFVTYEYRRNV